MDASFKPSEENKISPTIHKTSIEGLYFVPHKSFPDDRGLYAELARVPEIEEIIGQEFCVKQFNQSRSKTNVARGIHAENWNKLITVTTGLCFCALVDLRPDSPTFGKYESFYLGADEKALDGSIFVSAGIGNSFLVLKGPADYLYAVDAVWAERDADGDIAINLFDPDINIQWPLSKEEMIISERDRNCVSLKEKFS